MASGEDGGPYLEPAKGRIMTAAECTSLHPHHDSIIDGPLHVWTESLRVAVVRFHWPAVSISQNRLLEAVGTDFF